MIQIECLPNQGLNWHPTMISLRNVYVVGDIVLNEKSVCASRITLLYVDKPTKSQSVYVLR